MSYNVRDLLVQCLESLEHAVQEGVLSKIIVVDNDSADDSVAVVRERFPTVEVFESENLGYGGGANIGIEQSSTDYVLILNPDTVVPSPTIHGLRRYLYEHPDVAVAGPRMRYPDGSIQSSRRRFPRRLTPVFESTVFGQWLPGNRYVRNYTMADVPEDHTQKVDWLVGACLMVRRRAIDTAGAFSPDFWMYCEEIEWCWRFRHHGWKIVYVPAFEIVHHEAASTSQDIARRQLAFDRSRVELQRRLYCKWTARACVAGIKAGYLVQMVSEGLKFVAGHRRDLRRNRIAQYRNLLRASLMSGAGRGTS